MREAFQQLSDPGTHTACSVNLLGPVPAASEGAARASLLCLYRSGYPKILSNGSAFK